MKNILRQEAKARSFDPERSKIIQKKVIQFLENLLKKDPSKIVGTYNPIHPEVSCEEIEAFLQSRNQNIYHPQWAPEGPPHIEYPHEIVPDIILVPGLAFDSRGYRLGRGGGSFDRYLKKHPSVFKIGLAFSEQIVNDIDVETHDIPMDIVLTEHS